MKTQNLLQRWFVFIQQRFPLGRHLLLISALFGANAFVTLQTSIPTSSIPFTKGVFSFLTLFLAFFRLRIFDEIKDFKNDSLHHPTRPLARGLVSVREAKNMAFILIFMELGFSTIIGLPALLAASCYTAYSLLMYKEFFVSSWIRSKLATYAITHTLISSLLALFVFSALSGIFFWQAPILFLLFATANWMIFNVFEFGRKTFGKEEEKLGIDSYSKNFGPQGAASFIVFFALFAEGIAYVDGILLRWHPIFLLLLACLSIPLLILSFLYGATYSTKRGVQFRKVCSAFILFYNLIITLGFVLC